MFMIIFKYAFFDVSTADGARVAAQIVSGIGFLGAGVIFVKDDLIQGLTTAAGMWTTSGIAACIGAGLIFIGVFATLFGLFRNMSDEIIPCLQDKHQYCSKI